jgi:hypothetical protein
VLIITTPEISIDDWLYVGFTNAINPLYHSIDQKYVYREKLIFYAAQAGVNYEESTSVFFE